MKAKLDFWWIRDDGTVGNAPGAQLILYPKYPEVRLSGFLKGCRTAPSDHFQTITRNDRTGMKDGRVLVLSPVGRRIYAYLAPRGSSIATYLIGQSHDGLFGRIEFGFENSKSELICHLRKQYKTNPHERVRMYSDGSMRPYVARNAAGYTLEASFGIIPNGLPAPDFKGWELKCYDKSSITLMTPETDGGLYDKLGAREFIKLYGHNSEDGGMYFTCPYRAVMALDMECLIFMVFPVLSVPGTIRTVPKSLSIEGRGRSLVVSHRENVHGFRDFQIHSR